MFYETWRKVAKCEVAAEAVKAFLLQFVSYSSERIRLIPGDLQSTGSLPGKGAFHGNRWMRPGDEMVGELTYLGRQCNWIAAEDTGGADVDLGGRCRSRTPYEGAVMACASKQIVPHGVV